MLNIRLICVGKLGERFWKDAAAEYAKRLSAYCKLEVIEIPEQRLPDCPADKQIEAALNREAAQISAKIPQGAAVIAMCIEGETMPSTQFAAVLSRWMQQGTSRIAIVIGGSCGLDQTLKTQAKLCLSMSPMTFPHHLARIMVLEQLYRAFNIQSGGKYHK